VVRKSRGFRRGTRKKLKQKPGRKPAITRFIQRFKVGQRVVIELEPSSPRGMPHPRFKGKVGRVVGRRGKSYILEIRNGKKVKRVISAPEHLKAIG
jgi:large subunit ribosomal protein L21e